MIARNNSGDTNETRLSGSGVKIREPCPISTMAPWLLTAKVTAPPRPPAYVDRSRLIEQVEQARCPIVMLRAPAGFGKTTLLSEIFRRGKERGNLAAWLSLDEDDTEEGVGMYLMYAFERAGLPVDMAPDTDCYRMGPLVHTIGIQDVPCLLAIDKAERLNSQAIEALGFFLQRAPGNLRIVLGLRDDPGLDLSTVVLEGRGTVIGTDQLRFSKADIAVSFDGELSRRELTTVFEHTEGWPAALGFCRILCTGDSRAVPIDKLTEEPVGEESVAANWLRERLLRTVGDEGRDFLFDISQFDRIETGVVDDALGRNDTGRRLAEFTQIKGLLQQGAGSNVWHLHPLLKRLCSVERERENPARHRELHRAIALAMLERGQLLAAVRHAGEACDWDLVGSTLLQAGGLRPWLQNGREGLSAAEPFLTDEVENRFPRLALLRCRLLVQETKMVEAHALYEALRKRTVDFTRDRTDGDDRLLHAEARIIQTTLIAHGCLPYGEELIEDLIASLLQVKGEKQPDPAIVACLAVLLFAAYHQSARFERGYAFAAEAKEHYLLCNSRYGAFHLELHHGIACVAQGRAVEAESHYSRATRIAEQHFPFDPALVRIAQVLMAELNLERSRMTLIREQAPSIPIPFRDSAAWLDVYAAAHEVVTDWRFESGGIEDVLFCLEASCDFADSVGLAGLARYLQALRIGYLAAAERVDEARAAWLDAGLPQELGELLDLNHQSWREMEAVGCARIRLLIAAGELNTARDLADRLSTVTRERGLLRSLMRCLALSVALEHRAGNADVAVARLIDFLHLHAETGYARPMVRERSASRLLLGRLLKMNVESHVREAAVSVLREVGAAEEAAIPRFTRREREVLECLGRGRRDKEIARHLDLTVDGVRYHLKNIYRKTGTSGREEAVSRARSAGIIS